MTEMYDKNSGKVAHYDTVIKNLRCNLRPFNPIKKPFGFTNPKDDGGGSNN